MNLFFPNKLLMTISAYFLLLGVCMQLSSASQLKGGSFGDSARYRRNVPHGTHIEKCDREHKKMIIRASTVTLSKFLRDGQLWCKHARTLEIFALGSVTIDTDLTAGSEGLTVIMIAREWILVGNRTFDLSGKKGVSMATRAEDGDRWNTHGRDGAPGNPGQNGGSFYGIYHRLTKLGSSTSSSLVINVSGGEGGDGQDGGNGFEGKSGADGKYEDFPSPYSELDSKMERLRHLEFNVLYGYRYKNYIMHGKKGAPGGHGGDGGIGGIGGNPGFVSITSENDSGRVPIKILRDVGRRGGDGKGGSGGQGGKHGDGYQCTWRGVLADSIRWWDKCHYVPVSNVASELFAAMGNRGNDGGNVAGLREPNPARNGDEEFAAAEENFKKFVLANPI